MVKDGNRYGEQNGWSYHVLLDQTHPLSERAKNGKLNPTIIFVLGAPHYIVIISPQMIQMIGYPNSGRTVSPYHWGQPAQAKPKSRPNSPGAAFKT